MTEETPYGGYVVEFLRRGLFMVGWWSLTVKGTAGNRDCLSGQTLKQSGPLCGAQGMLRSDAVEIDQPQWLHGCDTTARWNPLEMKKCEYTKTLLCCICRSQAPFSDATLSNTVALNNTRVLL